MLLAIDTSNKNSGVALIDKEKTIIELMEWNTAYNHTPDLLPSIHKILTKYQLGFKDLRGLSINIGPGQFSGLRVGLTTAKTISWSHNLPLMTSTSLELEAYTHRLSGNIICPVMQLNKLQIHQTNIDQIDSFTENILSVISQSDYTDKDVIICGDSINDFIQLETNTKYKVVNSMSRDRITNLATIGLDKLKNNEIADPAVIEPFYMKPPTITKPK